jgi:hypothetical protein
MSQTLVKLGGGDLTALTPHLALRPEAAAAIAAAPRFQSRSTG